jgi:hypothetical protein
LCGTESADIFGWVRILVPFEGDGSGSGELSWGQLEMWQTMCRHRSSLGIGGVLPLDGGATVEDVADMVRFMMSRHQSLRTRLRFDAADQPRQVVSSAGEIPLEIVDTDEDPAGFAAALWTRYHDVVFDYVHEWPMRAAVVRHRGRPTHAVFVCTHLATDGFGLNVLRAELSTMDRASPVTATQPLEQARWQRSPAGRRQSDAALAYWETVLRTIPPGRFRGSDRWHEPTLQEVNFSSPAAHLATLAIAARTTANTSSVLLAAFAVALATVTGVNPVVTQVVVSNRFRPGLAGSVSTVSHPGLCVIDVAGVPFDEAVVRVWRALLRANKNAYFDPAGKQALIERVERERGEPVDLSCFYNDRRVRHREEPNGHIPGAPEISAARGRTTLRWVRPIDGSSERFFFHINDVPGTVDIRLSVDTRYVSPADTEAFLHGMESALVSAVA